MVHGMRTQHLNLVQVKQKNHFIIKNFYWEFLGVNEFGWI